MAGRFILPWRHNNFRHNYTIRILDRLSM
jgi:hypothetical protein